MRNLKILRPWVVAFLLFMAWLLITQFNPPPYAYHLLTYYISIGLFSFIVLCIYMYMISFNGIKNFVGNIAISLGIAVALGLIALMVIYYLALVSITLTPSEVQEVEVIEQSVSSGGGRYKGGSCIKWKVRFADGSESTRFCTKGSIRMTSPKTMARVRLTQTWIADEIYYLPRTDDES